MGFQREEFIGNPNRVDYTDDELNYDDHDLIMGALVWYNNDDDDDDDDDDLDVDDVDDEDDIVGDGPFSPDDDFQLVGSSEEIDDDDYIDIDTEINSDDDDDDYMPNFSDDSDFELRGIIENGIFIQQAAHSDVPAVVVDEQSSDTIQKVVNNSGNDSNVQNS